MKQLIYSFFIFTTCAIFAGCNADVSDELNSTSTILADESSTDSRASDTMEGIATEGGDGSGTTIIGEQGEQSGEQSGLITAGEWNDLDNWSFWKDILFSDEHSGKSNYWSFYNNNRVSVLVKNNQDEVLNNIKVELKSNGFVVWSAKTDNLGKAELWIDLFQENGSVNISPYELWIDDQLINTTVKLFGNGINEITIDKATPDLSRVEICLIVDATGSMADELEFLKADLQSVIQSVENDNSNIDILTSSIFYRDEGDDYLTRESAFASNISTTVNFIKQQSAGGGGDFPEAVHTALNKAVNNLQWSSNAKTRIAFLLLDAPPHHEPQVIGDIQTSIEEAARQGIKVIPITASGINKETEFLMRFMAMSTNGTYVFITNHSGIGGDHIEATVGEYQVEYLNDLMVRLIKKYSK